MVRTEPWLQSGVPGPLPRGMGREGHSLTCVSRELPADLDIALTGLEAVDGAHVVQPPTGHEVP